MIGIQTQAATPNHGIPLLMDVLEKKLDEKRCSRCKKVLSRKRDFDGMHTICNDCVSKYRNYYRGQWYGEE